MNEKSVHSVNLDTEILLLRSRLERLQTLKRKTNKRTPPKKSERKRGRPPVCQVKLARARELAKDHPIPDVAEVVGISLRSLYDYGIKRYKLNAEANAVLA
jgi:hypothetical protein